ncbi:UNVERIFIED_CONTAM: hypothetical protein GTU68_007157, partial [Idotea baltica]|nr:hypothetical protein [Idotea baltica]
MAKDILHTRNVLLRCMCAIYMSAFCSLYLQIPGLYGEKGILPGHSMIGDKKSVKECIMQKKTLLCSMSLLGLNTSYMMELIALTGTALSFIGLIWKKWCTTFLFAILWMLYLSLYKVGQTFLWFQWDSLLLEVGFLTIVVAPFTWSSWTEYKPRNLVTMWLVRWALFRLMFASGVVKLQSGCPTWWGLTALNVHYESQCIPTPLAWFVHHSPDWIHKLAVASTLALEIAVPFFFFSPIRAHRLFAFYTQVVFQLCIVLTGNYNFFNLLTMLLCLSLLDDVHLGYRSVRDLSSGFIANVKGVLNWAAKWTGYAVLTYYLLAYFSIKLSPNGEIEATISFTRENFAFWVSKAVPLSITIGAFSLLITVAEALTSCVFEVKGVVRKAAAFFTTLAYSFVVISLFGISLVPYTVLHPQTRQTVWPVLKQWHARSSDLEITSSYGLFRHMTGVGGRPEVILEGANKLEGPWIE